MIIVIKSRYYGDKEIFVDTTNKKSARKALRRINTLIDTEKNMIESKKYIRPDVLSWVKGWKV